MIHPSYSELIEAINTNNEDDDESMVLNSRYSLILATSKRARQLIGGAKPLADNVKGKKPLSIAIDELYHGKVKILPGKHEEEDLAEIAGHSAEEIASEEPADMRSLMMRTKQRSLLSIPAVLSEMPKKKV